MTQRNTSDSRLIIANGAELRFVETESGEIQCFVSEEDMLCDCKSDNPACVIPVHTVAAHKRWKAGGELEYWQPPTLEDDDEQS